MSKSTIRSKNAYEALLIGPKLLYFFTFFQQYSFYAFRSVFFKDYFGYNSQVTGFIYSMSALASFVGMASWSNIADRSRMPKTVFITLVVGSLIVFMTLYMKSWFSHQHLGYYLVVAVACMYSFFNYGMNPILSNTVLEMMARAGEEDKAIYGRQVAFGSLAYVVSNICQGYAIDTFKIDSIFTIVFASSLLLIVTVLFVFPNNVAVSKKAESVEQSDTNINEKEKEISIKDKMDDKEEIPWWHLLRNTRFILFLMVIFMTGCSRSIMSAFLPLYCKNVLNISGVKSSILMISGVTLEMTSFIFAPYVLVLGPYWMLVIAQICMVMRAWAYVYVPASPEYFWSFVLIELMKGAAFGLTHLAGVKIARESAPEGLEATAQGFYEGFYSQLPSIISVSLGGMAIEYYGFNTLFYGSALESCLTSTSNLNDDLSNSDQKEIYIASDHRGYGLKNYLVKNASILFPELNVYDLGPYDESPTDYTLKTYNVITSLSRNLSAFGVLICMDGIGMDIAGNYFGFPQKIFAANCRSVEDAVTAREHNSARILAFGSQLSQETAVEMIKSFVLTEFLGNKDPRLYERHVKRLKNITDFSDSVLKKVPFTNFNLKTLQDMNPHRVSHNKHVQRMKGELLKQFSHSWERAEDLIMPMTLLSVPEGPYACSCNKKLDTNSNWRPRRDEVGETKVTSFRSAIISFWVRILGIQDHDRNNHEQPSLKFPEDVSIFQNLFVEKVQPFLVRHWNIDVSSMNNQFEINELFLSILSEKYVRAIGYLKSSYGFQIFADHYSKHQNNIRDLETTILPYMAFIAEEILYPLTSYTDHGFLCYAYLNQRHVMRLDPDREIYQAHMNLTLAIHRAMILLQLIDINKLGKYIPESKQCTRFIYRTLTLPTSQESFDPLQLKFSLQHTSFSTHPIGALSVFQTVWCVRLREDPDLIRTMIISPADDRLSFVSGISKHPSEFEAIVPTFSEYIISTDPTLISENHLGWTALIDSFKNLVLEGSEKDFENMMAEQCGEYVFEIMADESACDDERLWKRRNSLRYGETAKCMYHALSREASENGTNLIGRFIPEIVLINSKNRSNKERIYEALLKLFKTLTVNGSEGSKISYWDNLWSQFESAYHSSSDLQKRISVYYNKDPEKYLLEYSISLCTELWWFGFKFVDDQIQRQEDLFQRPASIIPKFFYAVIFSFGIVIPNDIYEDFILNETLKVSLKDVNDSNTSNYFKPITIIAEGSTSVIGADEEGFIWKLFKEFIECPEANCP